jgi:hypothetical protein
MSYDSNSSWTTGIGQTLGAAQVIPLGQFKAHLAEAPPTVSGAWSISSAAPSTTG